MITIIDYKAGNQTSVQRALNYLGIRNQISADPKVILSSDRVIFPGVGHASSSMDVLIERGLDIAIKETYLSGIPILGICIGSQIILTRSEEGDTNCLDLLHGDVKRFRFSEPTLKIPHMGWNQISIETEHPVLEGIITGSEFYFVHSYYTQPIDPQQVFATCDYGIKFPVAIGEKNLFAVQFHAEKSGRTGLKLLDNFSHWKP